MHKKQQVRLTTWTREGHGRFARTALAVIGALLVLLNTATAALAAGYDLTALNSSVLIDNAVYRSYTPALATGSGVFEAFVRVGGGDVVKGYNTDGTLEFDTKAGIHTHSILLSEIPLVGDEDYPGVYREFTLDINQNRGEPSQYLNLDEVEVYLTTNPNITAYPFTAAPNLAAKVYELDNGTDNWIKLNYALNDGSGKRDLTLRVPDALFQGVPGYAYCEYKATTCSTYLVFFTQFGGDDNGSFPNNDGFEEWGVDIYNLASKAGMKFHDLNANGVKDVGEPGLPGWTIYVDIDNNGQKSLGEPSGITDASGNYTITNIIAGTYTVREIQQPGWTCSYPNNGGSDLAQQPVVSTACNYLETFTAGAVLTGNDFGNYQDGSLTVTKTVQWNGWPADSTTFEICIEGPSYPTGSEPGACNTFSAGESYTWQNLMPGTYTVTETNPDAANWTVTGEGNVSVASGGSASKTITNTRKMNDVTVTKTATTVYTRTNTYDWDIVKTVTPLTSDLFEGESGVLTYTVTVTPSIASQDDSGHKVQGSIQVLNPGPADSRVASVTDLVAGAYPAAVTCEGVTFPKVLAAGESFSCTYATGLPGPISGTNVATATLSNNSAFTGTANVAFGAPNTTINVNIPISVTDTYTIGTASASETLGTGIAATWSDTYERPVSCGTDLNYVNGKASFNAVNVARIIETGDEDDASAVINCYRPSVSKDAVPSFTRTYDWDIQKDVSPAAHHLFEGEVSSSAYTVTVTRTGPVDSNWAVTGTITVNNPNPAKSLSLTGVSDQLSDGQALAVNCATTTVPASGSIQCTYGGNLPNNNPVTNTATVTASTGIAYASPGVSVDFTSVQPTEINPSVTVTDTNQAGTFGPFTATDSFSYTEQFSCQEVDFQGQNSRTFSLDNIARIVQTGDQDNQTVTTTCYRPSVTKDAVPSFTRTYDWDIQKDVSPAAHHLFEGEASSSTYTVTVTRTGPVDSNWAVTGTITVNNPNPAKSLSLTGVSDQLSDGQALAVNCATTTVPASGSIQCTYGGNLPNNNPVTNTATVTASTGIQYSSPGVSVDFTGVQPTEINPSVTVTDTNQAGTFGPFTATDSFSYTEQFSCQEIDFQGQNSRTFSLDNIARIVQTGDQDNQTVTTTCYRPSVTKTAVPAFATTYKWDIDKTVTPAQTDLFEGDDVDLNYTVAVTRSVDSQSFRVDGVITVSNPNPFKALSLSDISDKLSSGQSLPVTCETTTIPAGGSIQCTYGGSLPNNNPVTNTATVTASTGIAYASPVVSVDFTGVQPSEINPSVNVTDTQPSSSAPWTFNNTGSQTYQHTVVCNQNAFGQANSYNIPVANTATIQQTGQSDSANANVTCWRLIVTKTADPSYSQPYDWDIQKTVDPTLIELIPGQTGTANYTVTVTKTKLDPTDIAVNGQINVQNPAPIPAVLTGVTDAINGQPVDSLTCGVSFNHTLPAGQTLTCSYSDAPGSLIFKGQNVATASLSTGSSFSGSAAVDFTNAKVTEILPQVNVDDTNVDDDPWLFPDSGVKTYPISFDCADAVYDENNQSLVDLDNIATILETGDNASAKVTRICRVGDLEVTKVVDWAGATPDENQKFDICITGPSFPAGDCKTIGFDGGKRTWQDLIPGTYTVAETSPGPNWTVSGSGIAVNVPAGGAGKATITNTAVIPASLGDYVWEDKDQDGIQDDDEPAIPGVTVNLLQPGPDGLCGTDDDVAIGTTITDAEGKYAFTNLLPGDYCIMVLPPPDFDFTTPNAGDDPTKNSKVDPTTGMTGVITLNPGENDPNQDAGLFNTKPTAIDVDNQPPSNMLFLPMLGRY